MNTDKVTSLKQTLANNLINLLNNKGMSQTELAKVLNLPEMTVSNWVNAKTYPRVGKIQMLADFFGVLKSDLTEEKEKFSDLRQWTPEPVDTIELPYLGTVSAGGFEYATEFNETMRIPTHLINDGYHKYFILKTNGDSMNREIANGHHIIVQDVRDGSYQTKNGDILIFKSGGEYTMKRVKKTDTMVYLEPDSYLEGFSTQSFVIGEDHDLEIIGKVVYSFKEY